MRTIRVTGKGQLKVHPDMTRITIELEGIHMDYTDTLMESSRATEEMKKLLVPYGFERSDLKTLSFDVNTQYESYKVKDEYKRRFAGYKYSHVMKVEFESDNLLLGKILYALANSSLHPEFRISYTVKDPEAVKNELLGKAVQDAVAKAEVLSSAAGLKLGEIQDMDYSWGRIDFEYKVMDKFDCPAPGMAEDAYNYAMDIEPDDIEAQDTVTVVWEIA